MDGQADSYIPPQTLFAGGYNEWVALWLKSVFLKRGHPFLNERVALWLKSVFLKRGHPFLNERVALKSPLSLVPFYWCHSVGDLRKSLQVTCRWLYVIVEWKWQLGDYESAKI
jgi:hypothetical protein